MGFLNKDLLSKVFPNHVDLFEQANNNVIFQNYIKTKSASCTSIKIETKSDYFKFINEEIIKNEAIDYMEFGVYEGKTILDWPKINTNKNSRFFAFDKFPPKYPIPEIDDNRVHFVKGLFQETLPEFIKDFKPNSKLVIFINLNKKFDTLYCLSKLDKILNEKCIIMFDQFGNLQHEFIAFHNYVKSFRRDFQFLCQSENWRKCAIELYPREKLHTTSKKLESYDPNTQKLDNKKKANIIFLLIDDLRLDKFYGKNRTGYTPNIDLLLKKSVFFNSAISSADGTFASMGSIFTSQYPSSTGITWANNHSKARKFFENIRLTGYELHSTFPDYDFFRTISKSFEQENCDIVDVKKGLFDGISETINQHIKIKKMKSPWFYYIHLMDMHLQRSIHKKFNSSVYGKTAYERKIALIDSWLGDLFELIDLDNTLLIITSDHGEYTLDSKMKPDFIPILQQNSRIKKNEIPSSLLPAGLFILKVMRKILTPYRQNKFEQSLDEYEIRTTYKRGKNYLFDEAIRIPLLFIGAGIKQSKIINDLVRHVDIFPTIAHLMKFPINQNSIDGRSLMNIIDGKSENEIPAIIESMPVLAKPVGDVIGVRTSKYKYFRSRSNPKLDVSLFDLENDPKEIKNLGSSKPEIIREMESILNQKSNNTPIIKEEITDQRKIQALKTLKEMGYD
jgi:arylsulfatase A-like enzyme